MRKKFARRFAATLTGLATGLALALVLAAPAAAADAQPLVSPAWLNAHLHDQNLVVLDIRSAIDGSKPETFAQGHIPGSVHSDYDKAGWRVTRNNVPFMVPTTPELEKLIGDLGIDENTHVVVVPAGVNVLDFGSAARTYWTLKYAGVGHVSILDGGLAAWKAAGYALASGPQAPSPAIFTATIDNSILALAPEVEKIEKSGGATLVDARPVSFFLGKEKAPAALAYGHIPGALNIDSAQFYDPATNRLRPTGRTRGHRARSSRRRHDRPIATPATGPPPTGSCCMNCSAARTRGSMPARWWSGPAMPAGPLNPPAPSGMT